MPVGGTVSDPVWMRPRHRLVLDALAGGELTQPDLIAAFSGSPGLPPNSVIRSARELVEHGLVDERRDGPVHYRLASD